MPKPYILIVTGRPGSGKTTFSKKLGKHLYLPVISRDELKEGYVQTCRKGHSELPTDTNQIVSNIFFATIDRLLSANISLIAEAAFQHRVWFPQLKRFQRKSNLYLLICKPEDSVAVERFVARKLSDPMREYFHGDPEIEPAKESTASIPAYEEPIFDVPTFHIDTTDNYHPPIEDIRKAIFDGAV